MATRRIPYSQQPPSGLAPTRKTKGLVYASAIPSEAVWSIRGWQRPSSPTANGPTFSKTPLLGKTIEFSSGPAKPVEYAGCPVVEPPLTLVLNFRQTTQTADAIYFSFGGSSTAGGWALELDDHARLWYGAVATFQFTLPITLVAGVDYTAVLVINAAGTADFTYRRRDGVGGINLASVATTLPLGPATKPLTLGAGFDGGGTYFQACNGHVGSFALWNRVMTTSEIHSLLYNPYQIWAFEKKNYGVRQSSFGADTVEVLAATDTCTAVIGAGGVFGTWLKNDAAARVVLVEVNVESGGVNTVRYLSTRPYVTRANEVPANTAYLPIVAGGISINEQLGFDGEPGLTYGDIEIYNHSGEYDSWLNDVWSNRQIRIYIGDVGWNRTDFRMVLDGVVADIDSRRIDRLNLKLRDKMQRLNTPITELKLGGTSSLADTLQPLTFGEVHNVTPLLSSAPLLQYQVHQSRIEDIIEVRDNGVPVSITALRESGSFRLLAPPSGQITASIQGDIDPTYANDVGNIVKRVITKYGRLSSQNLLANPDFAGGGAAPTSWTQGTGTGSSSAVTSSIDSSKTAYLQSATAQRPYLQQTRAFIGGQSYTISVVIESSTGFTVNQMLQFVNGAVTWSDTLYEFNGSSIGVNDAITSPGTLAVTSTAGTSADADIRVGIGCNGTATGTLQFSQPKLSTTDWLTTNDIDDDNFAEFIAANPKPVGLYLSDRTNVLAACHELAGSIGAQLLSSRTGKLRMLKIGVGDPPTPDLPTFVAASTNSGDATSTSSGASDPVFVAISSAIGDAGEVGNPNPTVSKPTGTADGDLLVWVVQLDATLVLTFPSGWTLLKTTALTFDAGYVHILAKVAGASEPSSYAASGATAGTWSTSMSCYRATGISIDTSVASYDATGSASPWTLPSVSLTTEIPNEILMWVGHVDNVTAGQITVTHPPGMTSRFTTPGHATIAGNSLCVADVVQASAGGSGSKTGTAAWTTSGSGNAGKYAAMVAIKGTAATVTAGARPNVARPAGVVDGDRLLWVLQCNSLESLTLPDGWTIVREDIMTAGSTRIILATRVAASEPSSYETSSATLSGVWTTAMLAYRGNGGASVDVHQSISDNTASATPWTLPGISLTTNYGNEKLVWAGAVDNITSGAVTYTNPSGFATRADITGADLGSGNMLSSLRVADADQTAAGASGTKTGSASGTGNAGKWSALLSLRSVLSSGEPGTTLIGTGDGIDITADDMVGGSLSIANRFEVTAAVKLGYCKNWAVQENLLTAIPEEHKQLFAEEWLTVTKVDSDIARIHRLHQEPRQQDSLLLAAADADAEASRRLNVGKVARTLYEFDGMPQMLDLELGQAVTLYHERFGLSLGKTGIVVSLSPDWIRARCRVGILI